MLQKPPKNICCTKGESAVDYSNQIVEEILFMLQETLMISHDQVGLRAGILRLRLKS